jgi:tetratricopeptide (TPR) repeat protein
MGTRALAAAMLLISFSGCSLAPRVPAPEDVVWMDEAFEYDAALVNVSAASLFALDDSQVRSLRSTPAATEGGPSGRRAYLLRLLFGSDMKAFTYAGGHSTVAAETWRNQRGDCLSLSVLSVALARMLNLQAEFQEVPVPVSFDRRGNVDFLNAHVNVLLRNDQPLQLSGPWLAAGAVVIDFGPSIGSRRIGTPLSDSAVLARFLNNVASERLAQRNHREAYAHYKAAIIAEPTYSASYNNLAQLYLIAGNTDGAEALLRRALLLNAANDLALDTLHRLLLSQDRIAEAHVYEQRLLERRDRDPYYWLGLGLERMRQAQYAEAVEALERAQGLTNGFGEVHRNLAIAYWYSGQRHKARDQLALLDALDPGDAGTTQLRRKFNQTAYTPQPR